MTNQRNIDLAGCALIARALGDENRLRALLALRGGELCVCQLIALLRLAPSTVSKHMTILQQAGLVACRKEGRWHQYRLAGPEAGPDVERSLAWALALNERTEQARADERLLRVVRRSTGPQACCGGDPRSKEVAR